MIYGYYYDKIDTNNIDLIDYNIDKEYIYIDSEISRNNYSKLLKTIKPNDVIIISSLSCLGNNFNEIIESWNQLVNEHGVIIKVLDKPILNEMINDTKISNILIDVIQQLMDNDMKFSKQKQLDGIRNAKEKGIVFGRPKSSVPDNTNQIIDDFINRKITNIEAAKVIGVSRATFFRMAKARRIELAGGVNE